MTFGSNNPFGSIFEAAERLQKDQALEDRLARWERPASASEEGQIERAARMVRAVLTKNAWLTAHGVSVEAQGSYHNNTNVRQGADMDLRVVHPAIVVQPAPGLDSGLVNRTFGYGNLGATNGQIATELRRQVELALAAEFTRGNVDAGNRAITIKKVPGSRADIDVVPALTLHDIFRVQPGLLAPSGLARSEGIWILGRDDGITINFPEQHRRNGIAKRERTTHRFKKVVRCLKSMRDEFVTAGLLGEKDVPSFLIESLVYMSDDGLFNFDEPRAARLRRILSMLDLFLGEQPWLNSAVEINGVKPLFGVGQPWTPANARRFVQLARAFWRAE